MFNLYEFEKYGKYVTRLNVAYLYNASMTQSKRVSTVAIQLQR